MTSFPNLANLRLKSILMRKKKDGHEVNPVEKLLEPISSLEPDSDCDSDVSEISDIFEEFHKNSYLRRQSNRYLTKHEADVKTMAEFTDDFKKTMANIRSDLQIGDDLLLENPDDIQQIFESPTDPHIFPEVSISKELTATLDESTKSIPAPADFRKVSDASSVSVIWHMLAVNSDNKTFRISPPGFDAFKQKEPHWLQRASVSWADIDQATLKCETWLERHCQETRTKK